MRFILPLFLFGMLATSCIDNNYDLSEIDTDGVVIGDEFRLPLATVTVSMSELGKDGTDIKALFDEADIWLPSPLPADGKYVDLQKIQHTPSYIDELLDELIEQMKRSDAKINAVADLLYDKYSRHVPAPASAEHGPGRFQAGIHRRCSALRTVIAGASWPARSEIPGRRLPDGSENRRRNLRPRQDRPRQRRGRHAGRQPRSERHGKSPKTRWTSTANIISALPVSLQFSAPVLRPRRSGIRHNVSNPT